MAELTSQLPERGRRLAEVVLSAIDTGVASRWNPAKDRAQAASGDAVEARIREVIDAFARELTTVGALTGGAAAIPAVGTATSIATSAGEMGWLTLRHVDLILTIAAIHGHTEASVAERKAWVMSVMAFGSGAGEMLLKLSSELGKGLGKKATGKVSTQALQTLNRRLGRTIITKYGTKRGVVALGTAFPFGIGAAIGAGGNYAMVRTVGRHADKLFRSLPPGSLESTDLSRSND